MVVAVVKLHVLSQQVLLLMLWLLPMLMSHPCWYRCIHYSVGDLKHLDDLLLDFGSVLYQWNYYDDHHMMLMPLNEQDLMVPATKSSIHHAMNYVYYDDRPMYLIAHNWTMYYDVYLCVSIARQKNHVHGEVYW